MADMRAIVAGRVTAGEVFEPLQACGLEWPAEEARAELARLEFDVAGVRRDSRSPVIGYVVRAELADGTVGQYLRRFDSGGLLSDGAPLHEVLSALRANEHAFVVVGRGVDGIVTRSDLNKPPVRVYFFGLVSLLELHLGHWIRAVYPESSWEGLMSQKRLAAAKRIQADRCGRHDEVDLLECIQFCDKRDLVLANEDLARALWNDPAVLASMLRDAEAFRNDLAHSQPALAPRRSWPDTIALLERIEAVIDRSDGLMSSSPASVDTTLWPTSAS